RKLINLWRSGLLPFGLDIETATELETAEIVSIDSNVAKLRKSTEKIRSFVSEVRETRRYLADAEQYLKLNVRDSDFWSLLVDAWDKSRQQTGYFNLFSVANHF